MDNVIFLDKRKKKKNSPAKKMPPDAQTVKLWRLSIVIDDIIKEGVGNDGLAPDEIAAVLAHRLGMLMSCCEDPQALSEFCIDIMKRILIENVKGRGA